MPEVSLESIVVRPAGPERSVVIWLHGLGDSGHGFEGIAAELRLPEELGVRFVFPHAPVRPITINGGMSMRGWYDVRDMDLTREEDAEGIYQSEALLRDLIQREIDGGMPARRIVLAGFSQGGAVSLLTAVRSPERLAGVIALSTYLPLLDRVEAEGARSPTDLPIFAGHGAYDPIIPSAAGERSRDALERLGFPVEWKTYPMEHSVCLEEIRDVAAWLERTLTEPKGDRSNAP